MGTSTQRLERIGIVGGGQMGTGIAEVCARAGCQVTVVETNRATATSARDRIAQSLMNAYRRGTLTVGDLTELEGRLLVTANIGAVADTHLVVEAIPEDEDAKVTVFRRLDEVVVSDQAILASNTSSISITKLAMATRRPERVVGLHFFNPVPTVPLVELVSSIVTADHVAETAATFATDTLHKCVVRAQDRAGFVANALIVPYLLSAIRMLESGFASAIDIDSGMVHGCAHPIGPLALADLIGLDTTAAMAASMYREYKEPRYSAPPLLLRMVDAGLLGRKSGRGFHNYVGYLAISR